MDKTEHREAANFPKVSSSHSQVPLHEVNTQAHTLGFQPFLAFASPLVLPFSPLPSVVWYMEVRKSQSLGDAVKVGHPFLTGLPRLLGTPFTPFINVSLHP